VLAIEARRNQQQWYEARRRHEQAYLGAGKRRRAMATASSLFGSLYVDFLYRNLIGISSIFITC
jgi:hypothetical protein